MTEEDTGNKSRIILRRWKSEQIATPSSPILTDERPRIRGMEGVGERIIEDRLAFIRGLEDEVNRDGLPQIHRTDLVLERPGKWESQLTKVALEKHSMFCALASFQNALVGLGIFDPIKDSQESLSEEAEEFIAPVGINTEPALQRWVANRAERRLRIETRVFQDAVKELIAGKVVMHGDRGHMVFLSRVEARRANGHSAEPYTLTARKVDPLARDVRSEPVSLAGLAKEEGYYRVLSVGKIIKMPTRVR